MIRLVFFIFCVSLLATVNAETNEESITLSPKVYRGLKKIEALIAKKSYSQAEQKLNSLLDNVTKKSGDHATVLTSLSSVYALKGQYKQAVEVLTRCLALNILVGDQKQHAVLKLGQLYMATEQYVEAIRILEPYLANNPKLDAQINVLLANAYTQLKRYRKALPYIKKAIATSKKPQALWYQLNLAIYFELNQYTAATGLLKTLIRLYPDKKTYWTQLSSVYQQLKQYKKAVSIKQLAYKKGFITTEKELLELANLLLFIHSPYKAATLISNEITHKRINNNAKNWEAVAQAWIMAKEFTQAIKALETASKLNKKGSLYQQLGQIYVEQEKWNPAIIALNKALNKGGLKNTGNIHLLLGMSYYELKQIKLAKKAFASATNYRKSNKAASQWLNYIKPPS